MKEVLIVGAGLAGCEAALTLASLGIKVTLFEAKPIEASPAHHSDNFAEVVCSNSFKSNDPFTASGLLKAELRLLGSPLLAVADSVKVPAGGALAVDRERFSSIATARIKENPNITVISKIVDSIDLTKPTIIATGPLTLSPLGDFISGLLGQNLYFYDAAAPIISAESVIAEHTFTASRYGKGEDDYINCPLSREEYYDFIKELVSAERATLKSFEKSEIFEGCMPVEVMADRGVDTLRFGPLKPVGLTNPKTGRWAYACLQLRKEDENGNMYNLVGFQTNLLWGEQKRVFSIIPALKRAEFLRYGVMHRNTFINSPKFLNIDYSLKDYPKTFFAGQITGVEGYVESAASGLMSAIYLERKIKGKKEVYISDTTVLGALARYITTENKDFEPMNANFGVLPPLNRVVKDKAQRKNALAERSLESVSEFIKEINND